MESICLQANITSCIPGRIRIKINSLFKNKKLEYYLLNMFSKVENIISIDININTGSILILYKHEYVNKDEILKKIKSIKDSDIENLTVKHNYNKSLKEVIYSAFNPFFINKNKKIYANEFILCKKTIKLGLFLGILVFSFTHKIKNLISIFILSNPYILFYIPLITYYYICKESYKNSVYIKNYNSLKKLENINTILLDEKLLINENQYKSELNNISTKNLFSTEKNFNSVNKNIQKLIKELRKQGITEFIIVSNKENDLLKSIGYYLGIEKIYCVKDKLLTNIVKNTENIASITTPYNVNTFKELNKNLIVCIYENEKLDFQDDNISIINDSLDFNYLLNLSRYGQELITICQSLGTSINIFLISLVIKRNIHPLVSFMLYIFNLLAQTFIIQNKVNYTKRSFI